MANVLREGVDISELSMEQLMVIEDIRELIQYSNKHGNPYNKKHLTKPTRSRNRLDKPPGLRLSDIIRLIFGYYIFNPETGQIDAYISKNLIDEQQFGDLRYDIMTVDEFKKDFIIMFDMLYGVPKGSMKSTLTNVISNGEKISEDIIVIQRLYDRGAKKKKTFKKKNKKKRDKKKTKMK